jgi:phosphoribosylaminoimidazolecarboxamide formyltransferase/IMP cyclohydrolase
MDVEVRNAIISVSDKTGLEELSRRLHEHGVNLYSTGGTARAIESFGIPVTKISDYTGFPEILDGRVKSLHPKIHGGILAVRDDESHTTDLEKNSITPFDLVVINLYPFEDVIRKPDTSLERAVENIDIGGPSMLRSAAKNYRYVCVVPDPALYGRILDELERSGGISLKTRAACAIAVFERTARYDGIIGSYLQHRLDGEGGFPGAIGMFFQKKLDLRYGENPHQSAAFYTDPGVLVSGVAQAEQLHGKELSFNNILDLESAFEIVKEFDEPACSIIKHTNPCGAAVGPDLATAFEDALSCDPVSAFGSIVGMNGIVDGEAARRVTSADFVECIIAPGYEEEALRMLKKKKNLRILTTNSARKDETYDHDMKRIIGGVLVQSRDLDDTPPDAVKTATDAPVAEEDMKILLFAWIIAKHVKSNAIVLATPTPAGGAMTVGIGAGQMSRVDATFMAITKAKECARGSVLASDAFFPKADAVELAAEKGIRAIIQPGGSIRDDEVITLCNEKGIPMVFTGSRHFRH